MELAMRGWNDLGVVDTIYEEDDEDSSTIPSLSPESTPSPTPQPSRLKTWLSNEPDVVIHVENSCFRLHKDPLIAKSGYLKRQLSQLSEITVNPPLKVTAETFSLVKNFCYGTAISITSFNIAALRVAAELLEMSARDGAWGDNLLQKTEDYFTRAVCSNKDYVAIVLKSCFTLLPEAETTAFLVSRCIDELSFASDGNSVMSCLEGVKRVCMEDFQVVLECMSQRLAESHDILYRIIDLYLREHDGKITEDQKTRICNYVDCSILSPRALMHAVQNPRMPMRFIVQAMFVEQLNTRRSIISAAGHHLNHKHHNKDAITLGAILERDAALRQVAQLKAAMNATSSRIQSLEHELSGMRKLLIQSENIRSNIDSGKSASFRFSSENKIERGQVGSVSSISLRNVSRFGTGGSSSSEESSNASPRVEKNFRRRFMDGIKSAFRPRKRYETPAKFERNCEKSEYENGSEDVIIIKKSLAFDKRSQAGSQM